MVVVANPSSQRAATLLNGYRRNLAQAVCWADPSWTCALLGIDEPRYAVWRAALERTGEAARDTCSQTFARAAGVARPSFDTLLMPALPEAARGSTGAARIPNLALLDVLPCELGLAVLRMRALSFRSAEVRRVVDKQTRSRISAWTGVHPDLFMQDAHATDVPDAAWLKTAVGMPPLAANDALTLAIEGWMLLLRDAGMAPSAATVTLLRLALPRNLAVPRWLAGLPSRFDAFGGERLFARLPRLLPGYAWLFG
ncbi:type III secretion protein HrpB4 [Burkholderia oklahomensis]|uniref:type III secretion protein HrpB4 n=1 Tax=Burkholderia oklahomensis TaxID=342113 RepID=UPI00016A7C93|nr:type III secretion protein HrpB4 [Burkholderia oklahomensis]AOI39596.1 type III secretion protein [Burkholderia oklahomensis EO147]AOI49276.1 type III secretion protein [Burkholderia oklahomensis C6786]KUY51526.1 type III secretion protein [Burkholderia oklahomensis EO147]KUY60676.1 type III secretion protein [Burkholderia oklahomensis C6786]MBI0362481.1 type III secretion protein HrpB4 [Burkholderia oklahomensis]